MNKQEAVFSSEAHNKQCETSSYLEHPWRIRWTDFYNICNFFFSKSKTCEKDKQLIFAVIADSKIATVPAEDVVLNSSWKFQAYSVNFSNFTLILEIWKIFWNISLFILFEMILKATFWQIFLTYQFQRLWAYKLLFSEHSGNLRPELGVGWRTALMELNLLVLEVKISSSIIQMKNMKQTS